MAKKLIFSMDTVDKSFLEDISLVPEKLSVLIEKYESKIQKLITEAKIAKNEIESKYEIKIAELKRSLEQIKDTFEGDKLVHEELLTELNAKCVELEDSLNAALKKSAELEESLAEVQAALVSEKDLSLSYKSQFEGVAADLANTTLEKETLEVDLDHCRLTLGETRASLNSLLSQKAALEVDLAATTEKLENSLAVISDLDGQVLSLTDACNEEKGVVAVLEEKVNSLVEQNSDLGAQNALLSEKNDLNLKKIEENTVVLNQVLAENAQLKEQLDAINGVSARNRRLIDDQIKRGFDDKRLVEKEGSAVLELIEKKKHLEIALAENEALRKSVEESKRMRLDMEKDKKRMRLEIETELLRKKKFSPVQSASSMPSIASALISRPEPAELPVVRASAESSRAVDPIRADVSDKKERRKSIPRQYFADDVPFTKDLVNERINAFVPEDLLSIEALSHALANKILRANPEQRLCYVCKDISKKKCEYITKGNKWSKDAKMSFLKECITPAIVKLANKFINDEKISECPRDNVIAELLSLIQKIKNDKTFFEDLKNFLVSAISYSE